MVCSVTSIQALCMSSGLILTQSEDREKLVKISNAVVELVSKYKGQMWGETWPWLSLLLWVEILHGKLCPLARQIKEVFDKDNLS